MDTIATTRMSSKGQVVIPEEIRDRLGLKAGSQFVVIGEHGVVILKTLTMPDMSEFDTLIREARSTARKVGMKQSDIAEATTKVRKRA